MTISVIGAGNAEQRRQFEHYADIRHRLMTGQVRVKREAPAMLPAPSQKAVAEPPSAQFRSSGKRLAVDMLLPCSWRFLVAVAAAQHRVTVNQILGKKRDRHIVAARYAAMALVFQHTQKSLPQIGQCFDRDHTTVLHALVKLGVRVRLVEQTTARAAASRPKVGFGPDIPLHIRSRPVHQARLANAYDVIRSGYAEGKTVGEIAASVGYRSNSVRNIARRLGIVRNAPEGPSA